ncbi:hypothetical protein C8R47DRAFT_1069925 [Mycena vitilis]|nr:hypothetical protein C8R47DRAFT_1069925 [Mycena vitilis]
MISSVKHYIQFLRCTEFVVQEAVQPAECGFDLVGIPHFEHSPVSVRPLTNQPQQLQSTHTTFVDTPDDLPNLRCCWRLIHSVGEVCSQKKASKAANLTESGGTGGLQEVIAGVEGIIPVSGRRCRLASWGNLLWLSLPSCAGTMK